MLPVVAVEVLLFLSRRNLDNMCAVSRRLEALIALACGTYPLRRVRRVYLWYAEDNKGVPMCDASILHDDGERFREGEALDEALAYLAPFCRHTYADEFKVDLGAMSKFRVSPRQWTDLTNIFRSGAARHLELLNVDLGALDDNAFVDAVRCHRLEVRLCDFRGRLLSDDVLRSFAANGVLELDMWTYESEEECAVSEDALLEFCFPPSGPSRVLEANNLTRTSDTFAAKFLERLLAPGRTSGPRGSLTFTTKKAQSGLASYAQHLVPEHEKASPRLSNGRPNKADPMYRFPSLRDGDYVYHFIIDYRSRVYRNPRYPTSYMDFSFGYFDARPPSVDE